MALAEDIQREGIKIIHWLELLPRVGCTDGMVATNTTLTRLAQTVSGLPQVAGAAQTTNASIAKALLEAGAVGLLDQTHGATSVRTLIEIIQARISDIPVGPVLPFSPSDVGDLLFWGDGRLTSTMTLTGSRCDQWRDIRGTGALMATTSLGVGANPIFSSSAFGGQGGLTCSASNQGLSGNFPTVLGNNFTIFLAIRPLQQSAVSYAGEYSAGLKVLLGTGYNMRVGAYGFPVTPYGISENENHVIAVRNNGGTYTWLARDILSDSRDGTGTSFTSAFTDFRVGTTLAQGTSSCHIGGVLVYKRALTDSQMQAVGSWMRSAYSIQLPTPSQYNILAMGNSLGVGYSSNNQWVFNTAFRALGIAEREWINWSKGGQSTPQLTSQFVTTVQPQINMAIAANKRLYVFWELTNDLAVDPSGTAASCMAHLVTHVQQAQAAGLTQIVVGTCLPRKAVLFNANFEVERPGLNAAVVAGAATYGYRVADVASDPVLGDVNAPDDTSLYPDKLHLTDLGASYASPYFQTAIDFYL